MLCICVSYRASRTFYPVCGCPMHFGHGTVGGEQKSTLHCCTGEKIRAGLAYIRVNVPSLQGLSQICMNGAEFAVPCWVLNGRSPRGRWEMRDGRKPIFFQISGEKTCELCLCCELCELQNQLREFQEPSNSRGLCRARWKSLSFLSSPFCYFCSLLLAGKHSCTISPISV